MNPLFPAIFLAAASVFAANASELPPYTVLPPSEGPTVTSGSVTTYSVVAEPLGSDVIVTVCTPDGYQASRPEGYPVVYAHDGQNLFDPSKSFAGVAWELDATAQKLIDEGKIEAPVIVGIYNRGALRPSDYFPEGALGFIPAADRELTYIFETCGGLFYGDGEARFVATQLKPLIDSLYNTQPDRGNTFAMGSSMGALASLCLMCEYPGVFGGAACLSTHWNGSLHLDGNYNLTDDPVCAAAILAYMEARLPSPDGHRLYLDMGTLGWDADNRPYEAEAVRIAESRGYSPAHGTLMVYDAAGAGHNEYFWQQRVDRPLCFLLGQSRESSLAGVVADDCGVTVVNLRGEIFPESARLPAGIYIRGRAKCLVR